MIQPLRLDHYRGLDALRTSGRVSCFPTRIRTAHAVRASGLQARAPNLTIAFLKRQCRQRLDQIARHIEVLDAEIAAIIVADPRYPSATKSSPASMASER